ncbi:MAG: hypothetical protein H0X25_14340 [Acidobacteriales bacterium]|nr:hypothetical protein [Terriglobales bacterium]
MMKLQQSMTSICLAILTIVPVALCQGSYTKIDEPDAVGFTTCSGVNSAGDIVGTYADSNGILHGFLLSSGTYTTIDYPDSQTQLLGINDAGEIVGFANFTPPNGFVYNASAQTFTPIDFPGADFTYPLAINNSGKVVGYITSNNAVSGFMVANSQYRRVVPLGAPNSYLYGISASGKAVGLVSTAKQTYNNFFFKAGTYSRVPISINDTYQTAAQGINSAGTAIVGFYLPDPPFGPHFGFLYDHDAPLQQLNFPGATETLAFGVNDSVEVVGQFADSAGTHGFLWSPNTTH